MARNRRNQNGSHQPKTSATTTGSAGESANRKHNTKARKDILRNAKAQIDALDAEAALKREEVKWLNKQIGDIFHNIKNDLGMKRKDLELVMRLVDLESGERDETLDSIREAWRALSEGEQASLFPEIAPAAGDEGGVAEEDDGSTDAKSYGEGHKAGGSGKSFGANPYDDGTKQNRSWAKGWSDRQEELAREMGDDPRPGFLKNRTAGKENATTEPLGADA